MMTISLISESASGVLCRKYYVVLSGVMLGIGWVTRGMRRVPKFWLFRPFRGADSWGFEVHAWRLRIGIKLRA